MQSIRRPVEVPVTRVEVKEYLSVRHNHLSLMEVISKFEGEDFVEDNLKLITEVFKLGFYHGWNQSYEEWMCAGEEPL